LHRPNGLFVEARRQPVCYIGETGPSLDINVRMPNLGQRISIVTHEGKVLARIGEGRAGVNPGQFLAPHGLAVDSQGNIYVGEASVSNWPRFNAGKPPPVGLRTLQRLTRLK